MLKIVVGLLIYTSFTSANAQENVLEVYKNYVDFLSKNDTVISQNIANADTPKYLPKKLEDKKNPFSYDIKLDTTNPMHIHAEEKNSKYELSTAEIVEIKPDGNAVTLENELLKKNQNSVKLHQVSNMYSKAKNMMKYAITGQMK
jgi:flagellar basal-body rod protein FlgB